MSIELGESDCFFIQGQGWHEENEVNFIYDN